MSAIIYKVASHLFTLAIIGRIAFLLNRTARKYWAVYWNYKIAKGERHPDRKRLQTIKTKNEFDQMMARQKAHREKVAELHYEYKGFINLNQVESDRKKLFEDKWSNWKFSKNSHELLSCPGDSQGQCIKMFGEMSFARKSIIATDPKFWTEGKESFWRKICHPSIKKTDIREKNLFDTRQRILAEQNFNHGDDDRHSA